MSLISELVPPKITIPNLLQILKKKELILNKNHDIYTINHPLEIIINSNNLNKFIETENGYKNNSFIYIARVGAKFDGHFLADTILKTNNYFIGNPENINLIAQKSNFSDDWTKKIISNKYFIPVNNIEESIGILFEYALNINKSKIHTIAVTGTNGKTSVVQICSQILKLLTNKKNTKIGTLGIEIGEVKLKSSHITTPDYPSFLEILNLSEKNNIQNVIMEATSHGLIENRLGNWKVDTAIFTNLTQDHLDYHGTIEEYKSAKMKLFQNYLKEDGNAVICTNNSDWELFTKISIGSKRKIIGVGHEKYSNYFLKTYQKYFQTTYYLSITDSKSSLTGISGNLKLQDHSNIMENTFFSAPLIGDFQIDNLSCAIGALICEGYTITEISKILKKINNIPGRLEIINKHIKKKNKNPTVLIDYAHTPDALNKVLHICKNVLKNEGQGKLITVFGCGGNRDKLKRPLMGKIASILSDTVVVTSDNPRNEEPNKIIDDIFEGISGNKNCLRELDRKKAIELAIHSGGQFDLILVAGKGHEDYQIIGEKKFPFSDAKIALSVLRKEN